MIGSLCEKTDLCTACKKKQLFHTNANVHSNNVLCHLISRVLSAHITATANALCPRSDER